jgi:hypothetical protein
MTTNDGWTDGQYMARSIDELRAEVKKQRRELDELKARAEHAEEQANAHRAKGRAEGFERAKEMAAGVCDQARALAERESEASHHAPTRRGWRVLAIEQKETAERIRAMTDDGASADSEEPPVQEPNRTCECGQPERAHDERGCFAWEWIVEANGKRFWGPSRCTRFQPRVEQERVYMCEGCGQPLLPHEGRWTHALAPRLDATHEPKPKM